MGTRLVLAIALFSLAAAVVTATAAPQIGTYQGAGCTGRERLAAHERWLGRPVDRVNDSPQVDSWATVLASSRWLLRCWQGSGKQLVFSLPMMTRDGRTSLAEGAAGAYDATFRELGALLVERGFADATIRISQEFNARWFPWTALNDAPTWVAYWRRIVGVLRAVPGAQFRFDWNPMVGAGVASPEPAYPGDDVVDLIGADVYNGNWNPGSTAEQRWAGLRHAPFGLEWHRRFAAARGKPMSFPEWGTGTRPDGHGGGDDPVFMRGMAEWIRANPVAYHVYWDYAARDYNGRLSDGSQPRSAAIFLAAFGGGAAP